MHGTLDHHPGQLGLGPVGETPLGDTGLQAALRIVGPGLRQQQFTVHQGIAVRGDIGGQHGGLAVLDAAGDLGVLAGRGDGLGAFLQGVALPEDEHRLGVAQVFGEIAADGVLDGVGVPACPGEQALHPPGGRVADPLGELPGGAASAVGEQAQGVLHGLGARFGAGEERADPLAEFGEDRGEQAAVDLGDAVGVIAAVGAVGAPSGGGHRPAGVRRCIRDRCCGCRRC